MGAALGGTSLASALLDTPAARADGTFVSTDPDQHLLRRATNGVTPKLLDQIRHMGRGKWLDQQLAPGSIDDSLVEDLLARRYPDLTLTVNEAYRRLDGSWDLMFELGQAAIVRAAWSKRQLFEVMVDFWSNHLNVANPSDNVWWSRHDYDRRVIRKHALGRFSDMLAASATHPAMTMYLNNAESTKDAPNENYGRELLELHTVGVEAGYSETEMRNSALILTGFGISWDTGEFEYDRFNHYTGQVQVLGWSSANDQANGYAMGLDYIDYLARHRSTAHRIATKLCQRFVSDIPPDALVDKLAQVYLDHDTAMVPVLRALFSSTTFKSSIGEKVRRPMQDVVAVLRVLGIKPDASGTEGLRALYWMLEGLGDAPLAWGPPNGYPDVADAWRSAGGMLGRWNTHLSLAAHWWPKTLQLPNLRDNLLPRTLPATHGGLVDALSQRLVFRKLSAAHRDAVLGFLGRSASDTLDASDEAVRWRLPYLVALILDSPYHGIR